MVLFSEILLDCFPHLRQIAEWVVFPFLRQDKYSEIKIYQLE